MPLSSTTHKVNTQSLKSPLQMLGKNPPPILPKSTQMHLLTILQKKEVVQQFAGIVKEIGLKKLQGRDTKINHLKKSS